MLESLREKMKGAYLQKVKGECIFCHLLEEDSDKIIYETEDFAVFPPLKSGALKDAHLLLVPKTHFDSFFKMEQEDVSSYFKQIHSFLNEVRDKSHYSGANLLSANGSSAQQSINHLHFHVVLREESEDYDLWPDTEYNGENFDEVNKELKNLLN
ncbi:MAG: HIT family protein [Candidatus Nanohalobium sp.]